MAKSSRTDWKRLESMKDKDIDRGDIAELSEKFFKEAVWRMPGKQSVTIRIDTDVLDWFKSMGKGYQTHINQLLRRYMEAQQ
jgi:uncharacterized protein (DUF4415 family)